MIYTIRNDKLTVEISSIGAELQSVKYLGKEYLWDGNPEIWDGRAPVLFPIIGNAYDGEIECDEKLYKIAKHGFARDTEFKLTSISEESCTFTITDTEETLKAYPYKFTFNVTYSIVDNKLITAFEIFNNDIKTLACSIGGHPAFLCPSDNGSFEDWEIVFSPDEELVSFSVTDDGYIDSENTYKVINDNGHIKLNRDLFAIDALIFDKLNKHIVTLMHKSGKQGVTMEFNDFPSLGIWTKPLDGAKYVCLEPWCGMGHLVCENKKLFDKHDIIEIEPSKSIIKAFTCELF